MNQRHKATHRSGIDRLVADDFREISGLKIGVIAHPASVDHELRHTLDILFEEFHLKKRGQIVRLFGPEHGIRGALQDMEADTDSVDLATGLPVVSLYGNTEASLTPTAERLAGLDALVIDLQDIGTRYYTFVQTLGYAMKAAAAAGIKIIVLDRINPLGGEQIEGSALGAKFRSFCGYYSVPVRHGLTIGEFAKLMNSGFGAGDDALPALGCDLTVVPIEGWTRSEYQDQTDIPWVLPSPNMPTLETAIVYPGACLFEATTLSEGRGTTRPFELLGAPYIDGTKWRDATLAQGFQIEGCTLRPTWFIPKFQKWAGSMCGGVQIHVTDRKAFQPYRLGLSLIRAAKELYPKEFGWRTTTYEFIDVVAPIDLLYGSDAFRQLVDSQTALSTLESSLLENERNYEQVRKSFLLY